jgi:hypothetical protein
MTEILTGDVRSSCNAGNKNQRAQDEKNTSTRFAFVCTNTFCKHNTA